MGLTLTEKILKAHLVEGAMVKGSEIGIRIDQTLTQDATGTMAYLEFEAMGVPRVRTERSVAYIDHNTLQNGFENADDHRFIGSVAKKHGIYFSRPGNGICHQVHLERFGVPGKTLIGSDSHTPTGGGIGMIAMGAGGLDVAVAMGGGTYYITCPKVVKVELTGKLSPWVAAKDVILEVLRRMSVKGGICTGLFGKATINDIGQGNGLFFGETHLFFAQLASILITIAVAVVGTLICYGITRLITGSIRVEERSERIGLDRSEHGESAYPSFNGLD